MRDTPVVDAMMKFCFGTDEEFVRIKDAAKLERELNAANESFRKLNIHALDLAARIKRLEEAGEKMVDEPLRKHRRWILNEAKEAKP